MGDVIPLFGPPPAADGDDAVGEFVEEHLNQFFNAVQALGYAEDRDDMNTAMQEVRLLVRQWPKKI